MKADFPSWAMTVATSEDRDCAQRSYGKGTMQVSWSDRGALRQWAKTQGWPSPRFGFEGAFIAKMLADDESFALALNNSHVVVRIPRAAHTISAEEIGEFDALYTERPEYGQPTGWRFLVESLREIRRAVEAGVVVSIEDTNISLKSWQRFYDWAHGRYPLLEEGYDSWIGDDES